jgi:UMF1 family MFS transporter
MSFSISAARPLVDRAEGFYAASRSMMVRHTNPDRPTEAFGLFALAGKATAFLAPASYRFIYLLAE